LSKSRGNKTMDKEKEGTTRLRQGTTNLGQTAKNKKNSGGRANIGRLYNTVMKRKLCPKKK